jgi:hypothetical protein
VLAHTAATNFRVNETTEGCGSVYPKGLAETAKQHRNMKSKSGSNDKNLVPPFFYHSSLIHPQNSGCNVLYPVHKRQLLDSLLSQLNPMHNLTHNVSYVFNIILHPCLGLPIDSSPCFFFFNKCFVGIPKFQEV